MPCLINHGVTKWLKFIYFSTGLSKISLELLGVKWKWWSLLHPSLSSSSYYYCTHLHPIDPPLIFKVVWLTAQRIWVTFHHIHQIDLKNILFLLRFSCSFNIFRSKKRWWILSSDIWKLHHMLYIWNKTKCHNNSNASLPTLFLKNTIKGLTIISDDSISNWK